MTTPSSTMHGDDLDTESRTVSGLIFQMTTHVSAFKRSVDVLGTGKDTRELRAKLHDQREKLGVMARDASLAVKRLAQAVTNAVDVDDEDKAAHVAKHQKLVKDFHAVLKDFQKAQRTCAERESTFLPQKGKKQASYGTMDEEQAGAGDGEYQQESQVLMQERGRSDFAQIDSELEYNNALIEERERGILEIQQQIGEVNEIFQDLAVLVNEQGSMIDDIEANIVSTAVRTKDAQKELTKADKSQRAARNRLICIVIAVLVALIVLILFLLQ
jgi:syntaxin 7